MDTPKADICDFQELGQDLMGLLGSEGQEHGRGQLCARGPDGVVTGLPVTKDAAGRSTAFPP